MQYGKNKKQLEKVDVLLREGGFNAWYRILYCNKSDVYRNDYTKMAGFSVRCVKNN